MLKVRGPRHLALRKLQRGFVRIGLGLGLSKGGTNPVRALFANGEPGAVFISQKPAEWGSNPDLVTMFQDSAGTTPVTALEQTVGLQLDVRPIFLGASVAAATYGTSVAADNTTTATSATSFTQTAGTTPPRSYLPVPLRGASVWQITFTVDANTAGGLSVQLRDNTTGGGTLIDSTFISTPTAGMTRTITLRGTGTAAINWVGTTAGGTFNLSGISVREVIASPNGVGQPLRTPQLWNNANVGFGGGATQVSPGVYRIFSSDGTLAEVYTNAATGLTVGAWYEAQLNIDSVTTAGSGLRVGSNGPIIAATVGPKRVIFQADAPSANVKRAGGITDIQISGVSYRMVYGNHRAQATAGARAKLSARYNKVTARTANPVDLTNVSKSGDAAATLTVVNDAAALAAAGLDKLCTLGNVYKLDNSAGAGSAWALFEGQTGNTNAHAATMMMRTTGGLARIESNGGTGSSAFSAPLGYTRLTATFAPTATGRLQVAVQAGAVAYFILPDLREACYSYLPTPQVIDPSLAIGYDDTGFPARLVYSGAQGFATGTVDLTAYAQLQFFAAASKLSDAATAILLEHGVGGTDARTMSISWPRFAGTDLGAAVQLRDGVNTAQTATTSTASPLTQVITALPDYTGATVPAQTVMRMNGAPNAGGTVNGTVATGTFGSYPLYYGSRSGNGTVPFIGDEFCSIVRGGPIAANDPRIAQVERFCAQKMALAY